MYSWSFTISETQGLSLYFIILAGYWWEETEWSDLSGWEGIKGARVFISMSSGNAEQWKFERLLLRSHVYLFFSLSSQVHSNFRFEIVGPTNCKSLTKNFGMTRGVNGVCIVKWFASQRKPVQQLVSAGYKDENRIYRLLIYQITIPMALSVREQIGSNMTSCLILYPGRAAIENAPVPWQAIR